MAVYQQTRMPTVSLPNGCRSLPIELLQIGVGARIGVSDGRSPMLRAANAAGMIIPVSLIQWTWSES